jgi:hypothetical protein
LVLVGRSETPALAGEAKWAITADADTLVKALRRKVEVGLKHDPDALRYAVCARNGVTNAAHDVLVLTAADLFSIEEISGGETRGPTP